MLQPQLEPSAPTLHPSWQRTHWAKPVAHPAWPPSRGWYRQSTIAPSDCPINQEQRHTGEQSVISNGWLPRAHLPCRRTQHTYSRTASSQAAPSSFTPALIFVREKEWPRWQVNAAISLHHPLTTHTQHHAHQRSGHLSCCYSLLVAETLFFFLGQD